jgi:5'-nucleotidase (lipoprotein e(P4) family)
MKGTNTWQRFGLAALVAASCAISSPSARADEALIASGTAARELLSSKTNGVSAVTNVPPASRAAVSATSPYKFASTNLSQGLLKSAKFRSSVEFAAITVQIYRAALKSLQEAAAAQNGDWAIVLDIDDTVLDNTQYNIDVDDQYAPASWDAWVQRKAALPVEGAKEFLDEARKLRGINIVFITDRTAAQEAATIDNMRVLGLWGRGDLILGRKDKPDTKAVRRRCVELALDPRCAGRRPMPIVALYGDSARDFEEYYEDEMRTTGRANILAQAGKKYWIFPNPMYGQWARDYK